MEGIFIGLGSNLEPRGKNLQLAIELLSENNLQVVAISRVYETAAWGNESLPAFLNQVIKVETELSPMDLLAVMLNVEKQMGRVRAEHWGSRNIDLDLLFYHNQQLESEELVLPHPWIQVRRFVLMPLHELVPEGVHPIFNKNIKRLLDECPDSLAVTPWINELEQGM